MKIDYVSAAAGIAVFTCGALMLAWQIRRRHRNRTAPAAERQFLQQQFQRRAQTGGVVAFLGLLILLSDFLSLITRSPSAAALYVIFMLFLAIWLILLGISDAIASRLHLGKKLRQHSLTRQSVMTDLHQRRDQLSGAQKSAEYFETPGSRESGSIDAY